MFRLVYVFVSGFFNWWVRVFAEPLRELSPMGLFTAMGASKRNIKFRIAEFVPRSRFQK